jgi:flavin reductase (DIM6/NTAB) family NADH-FMN oxidoreductase RutF
MVNWRDYVRLSFVDGVVGLLSSSHDGVQNAMTVSLLAESSHVPPLVRVSVSQDCLSHELVAASGRFGLSILAEGQEELALRCGVTSGRDSQKLRTRGLRWQLHPSGVPMITSCRAVSICRVVERREVGDHTVFVGDVVDGFRETLFDPQPSLLVSGFARWLGED